MEKPSTGYSLDTALAPPFASRDRPPECAAVVLVDFRVILENFWGVNVEIFET